MTEEKREDNGQPSAREREREREEAKRHPLREKWRVLGLSLYFQVKDHEKRCLFVMGVAYHTLASHSPV
jgi:hypothetical protein